MKQEVHQYLVLIRVVTFVFLSFALESNAYGQCDTGSEPECACSTAPVLCTVDSLDAYSFSMSSYQHPADGPDPLCSGSGNESSIPNNPTWFAFVAWCTDLTINVHPTNCTANSGGVNGVQVAIYSDCNYTQVVCNVQASDCNTNDKTLSMNSLTIGDTYYFLIDGCLGAYCDIEIDVVGVCGDAVIADWTEPIDGPTEICAGTSPAFSVEDLDGATDYHWYIDGVLVVEGDELTTFSQLWNATGIFEICVDASNVPCIPESDPPDPICITVEVFEAEAGVIMANPNPVCPGDTIYINASGYNADPEYSQFIVITDASGTIVEVIPGDAGSWTHDVCASFFAYSYNYHGAGSTGDPAIGQDISTIDCADGCCDQESIPLEFVDDEEPVFPSPPPDMTLTCYDELDPMSDLEWTDNCDGTGMVSGTETGTADFCAGGTLTRQWEYTDQCSNTAVYVQTITMDPVPPTAFVDLPGDTTVDCSNIPASAPDLQVENSGTGGCLISAAVVPVQNGTADICGGSFTFEWEYTDTCGNTISHIQSITVLEIPEAAFTAMPADTTVMCDAIPTSHPSLTYTNGLSGECSISGTVAPVIDNTSSECGGDIRRTWEFTDTCGRSRSWVQTITVEPAPEATWVNPPGDTTIECSAIPTVIPMLSYTNGAVGTCEISGSEAGTQTVYDLCQGVVEFEWRYTDNCNRTIIHIQRLTILAPPPVEFVNAPADTTVECGAVTGTVPQLSYTNNTAGACMLSGTVQGVETGVINYCGGQLTRTWTVTDPCGLQYVHTQTITVEPAVPAVFLTLPPAETLNCTEVPSVPPSLSYSNGLTGLCAINGTVFPGVTGSYNACGGSLKYTWTFLDNCGRSITHVQDLIVLPASAPSFINPPIDATLSCDQVPVVPPVLSYGNGQPGLCGISGFVAGSVSGAYDQCGGMLTYLWSFTDACGNTIDHTQLITVTPANDPIWIDAPGDTTLGCDGVYVDPGVLSYSNNQSNPCSISGTAFPVVTMNSDGYTHTWSYTHPCTNALIEHVQMVTIVPSTDIVIEPHNIFVCEGETFDLTTILVQETNNIPVNVTYHSGSPAVPGNELPSPTVDILNEITYVILGTNSFGCQDEEIFTIYVDPSPSAGDDFDIYVCQNDGINLYDYLPSNADDSGYLVDADGSGADLSDLSDITFLFVDPGVYALLYIVEGSNCPPDTSVMQITVFGEPVFEIESVFCTGSNTTYTVVIYGVDLQIVAQSGTVDPVWPDVTEIRDIPIDEVVTFDIWNIGPYCIYTYSINPPNCDCPNVPAPVSTGNVEICEGAAVPALEVTVSDGTQANWYDMALGGSLLAAATVIYAPAVSLPGTYTYYVEAESIQFPGCVSSIRTPVVLVINPLPVATDIALDFCDDAETGSVQLDLAIWRSDISGNQSSTVSFYLNQADAQSGSNSLTMPVNIVLGSQVFYARVENANGCVDVASVDVVLNPLPAVDVLIQAESCLGDSNGVVQITGFDTGQSYQVRVDNVPYTDVWIFADLASGSHSISVESLVTGCAFGQDVVIPSGANIMISLGQLTCFNNGTDSDGSDDYYTIEFQSSINAPGDAYELFIDGISNGYFPYSSIQSVNIPALGQRALFRVVDTLTGCEIDVRTALLIPCSSACNISIGAYTLDCNDNGTPLDSTDDVTAITFTANAIFGAGDGMYTITIDGASEGDGSYGIEQQLVLPADGLPHDLILADHDDPGCTLNVALPVFRACSDSCALVITLFEVYCDNAGTNQDEMDDLFFGVVQIDGINVGGTWQNPAPPLSGVIGKRDTIGPLLISAGDVLLNIESVDGDCQAEINLEAPPACSFCSQTIDAGPDQYIDCGSPTVTLTLTASESGQMSWLNPLGTVTSGSIVQANLAGQYIGTVMFDDGCVFSDTVIVLSDPTLPTVSGGPDQAMDCEVTEVSFTAEIITGTGPFDFEWTDETGTLLATTTQLKVDSAGTYYVQVYDSGVDCWSGQDAVEATDASNTVSATIFTDPGMLLSCDIQSVHLSTDEELNVEYTWITQSTEIYSDTLLLSDPGKVVLIALDTLTHCTSLDSIEIILFEDYPIIVIDPVGELSCAQSTVSIDASASMVGPNGSYIWTNMTGDTVGTSSILNVNSAGNYYLELTDPANGCSSQDSINIEDVSSYPDFQAMADVQLPCEVMSDTVSLILLDPLVDLEIIWTNIGGKVVSYIDDTAIIVEGAGMYIAQMTDVNTGCISRDTVIVSEYDPIDAMLAEAFSTSCLAVADGAIFIEGVMGGTPPFTYKINGKPVLEGFVDSLDSGTYTLSVDDSNGCMYDTTLIIETGDEVSIELETIIDIVQGDEQLLTARVNVPAAEIGSVRWTPGTYLSCDTCLMTTASPREKITYTVQVTDIYGCSAQATVVINVAAEFLTYIPNTFSPGNEDGINDYFTLYTNQAGSMIGSMQIFDRWGDLVFSKNGFPPNDPAAGWDGTFNGRPMNPAVFVYVIKLQLEDNTLELYKGDVTVIR